jgi:succinate dehydrogenase flavin-adding protein (antitoxin of CptAB toxin-antitoxin module)
MIMIFLGRAFTKQCKTVQLGSVDEYSGLLACKDRDLLLLGHEGDGPIRDAEKAEKPFITG